jgi:hypothetical protein
MTGPVVRERSEFTMKSRKDMKRLFQSAATGPQAEGEFPHEPMFSGARFASNQAFAGFSKRGYMEEPGNIPRNS